MLASQRDFSDGIQEHGCEVTYTIGELSREFGVSLRTIRFYEERGFLDCVRNGRKRLYSDSQRERLEAIVHGRKLGFSLAEIGEILPDSKNGMTNRLYAKLSSSLLSEQIELLELRQREICAALADLRQEQQRREKCASVPKPRVMADLAKGER